MDYGAKLSDTLRFHVGGFYRQGEGPRRTGFDATKGGQVKFNVTKTFTGGYVRLIGKYLDDRTPAYGIAPVRITGTATEQSFESVANFPVNKSTLLSRYFTEAITVDGDNNIITDDVRNGLNAKAKTLGFETQFDAFGFTIGERFRYSDISSHFVGVTHGDFDAADALAEEFAGPGGRLSYVNGPSAGQPITNLAGLNGNGLLAALIMSDTKLNLDNITNDLRISRVWKIGDSELTTTAGFYAARQTIDSARSGSEYLTEVRGDGNAALVNLVDAAGQPVTQNGYLAYGVERRTIKTDYAINAPFASANYRTGRLSIGASVRYEFGTAKGSIFGAELGDGRVGTAVRDVNRDGIITGPEANVGIIPLDRPAPVDYSFNYLSYSTGINFRIAEPLAVFARYSRGGRVNADRILFSPLVSTTDGSLDTGYAGVDFVRQVEGGVKYRKSNLTLNLTGFQVVADDSNLEHDTGAPLYREYDAKGLEFEGGYRVGPFGLTAGATYTISKVKKDRIHPELEGNVTRHQPKLIFQATPQFSTDRFSIGAVFIGSTSSYADDENEVLLPGYVTTNAFVQFRPLDHLLLSLNANNLLNVTAFTDIDIEHPETGIGLSYPLNGRTISAAIRFDF
jgi:outer membrane receptor protein involved in Fe transport